MAGNSDSFSIALTGDSFITTKISEYKEPDFVEVFDIIRSQDLGFTNLEVLLNDFKGIPAAQSGGTYAGAPTALADELKWAGFQIVARANNHSLDYSYEGLRITTETLNKKGIVHAGVGENLAEARSPAYCETHFGRVALLSASSSFAPWGRAGHTRPDFQGRPGLSPLRYGTKLLVKSEQFQVLTELLEAAGFGWVRRQQKNGEKDEPEQKRQFSFGDITFVESDVPGLHTEPNEKDVEEITKWIKDAKRQADWVLFTLHAHESHLDRTVPAEFVVQFAKACIDAGADMFIGHGPHLLRGIEIYNGKPIFYSLGNFIFQNDLVYKHPQDIYDRYGLSLEATPADMYDTRSKGDKAGFPADPIYWESVIAVVHFENKKPVRVELIPISLGHEKRRSQRGKPHVARGEKAQKILNDVKKLSEPFSTAIDIRKDRGFIEL